MHTDRPQSRYILVVVGVAAALVTRALRGEDDAAAGTGSIPLASQEDIHARLFRENPFPSASECANCHSDHYREWSASSHAYAQISPVFNAMHGTMVKLNNGTFGDFCIRCHTPVGMAQGEPIFTENAARSPVSLEGVTCVVCHRQNESFGKTSGRTPLQAGDIFAPVYGPRDDSEFKRVLSSPGEYGVVVTDEGTPGRQIHAETHEFFAITKPGFCGSCHDVTFINGFRLEEAFSEYKQSPAAKRGETCQDCHMGTEPGIASGYAIGPAARVGGVATRANKRTNHMFVGPDYSIVHPGIFPHNPEAKEFASMDEWVQFDVGAGWGTDEFEESVGFDTDFPDRWLSPDDRYEARRIIEDQLGLLSEVAAHRSGLLRRGYVLGDVRTIRADSGGIVFEAEVRNGTDGHNVPTGFIAERVVFLRVTVRDPGGGIIFESGDLDPNGDLRDPHSLYVHNGELPLDDQLFSLQSKFLTRNVRGGEREQVLAVNFSFDPLPFARPATRPTILTGSDTGARIHRQGIAPGDHRWARYKVNKERLTGPGVYSAEISLIAGMIPVNLVDAIKDVGFDYGMSARDVADAVVDGHQTLWQKTVSFEIE